MDDDKIVPMTKDIKRPTRPLTLKDVSEASGVSEMTVSRVLRNRGDVSDATREKVLKTAKKLGYVPNKIAGALASNRVNLVAVIIPSLSNLVFPDVLTGISEALDDSPLQSVVGPFPGDRDYCSAQSRSLWGSPGVSRGEEVAVSCSESLDS